METVSIFSAGFQAQLLEGVSRFILEQDNKTNENALLGNEWSANSDSLCCSYCRIEFENVIQQREHYKQEWHTYNLKQSLSNKLPITEEDFNEKINTDNFSSTSESEEDEGSSIDTYAAALGKIFLENKKGQVFSIYKCVLFNRKEEIQEQEIPLRLEHLCNNRKWTIVMLGGGYFAGAVFNGNEPVLHKTFHCYTVRAGQGGAQSSRDNKSAGSQPKSAGASLRRYNEQALIQHVKSIVEQWKSEISESSLIIYRASGPYNRAVLFGGTVPLFDRCDTRLRTIPFSTRKATYKEIIRVHSILSSVQVYDSLNKAIEYFTVHKSPERLSKKSSSRSACINRAKSRELAERPLPGHEIDESQSDPESIGAVEGIADLSIDDLIISTKDVLLEYDDSLTQEQRKQNVRKKTTKKSKARKAREKENARREHIQNALITGDINSLREIIDKDIALKCEQYTEESTENVGMDTLISETRKCLINEVIDDNGNTMLHLAALNENNELLGYLLENDANPCLKNKNQYTAYTCTQSREIRQTLKNFAKENPDKYDYNKAQIPVSLLTPEEILEKKRMKRAIKKEKEIAKKKETQAKRKEQEEKERFLCLTDREKRALAAERRLMNQSGAIFFRCFLCGSDITGKVPFEYMNNRFCSIECLKCHRANNPVTF